jgi:hypothetical protein
MATAPAPVRTAPPPRPVRTVVPKIELNGTPRQGVALLGKAPPDTQTLLLDGVPVYLAPDKRFIIAFDRDAPPSALLRATLADGAVSDLTLAVGPGNWPIEKVNAPLLGGAKTSEEFQRRRTDELAQIAGARGGRVPSDGWQQAFIWPVKARISGWFGAQRIYQGTPGSYHSGVDLAGGAGTIYVAPADGVVVLAADHPFTLEGNLLIIDHGMGLNSAFLHSTRLLVKIGDVVKQGQPIGVIGATGRVSGPHLHWSMKWQAARIDPETFVAAQPGR